MSHLPLSDAPSHPLFAGKATWRWRTMDTPSPRRNMQLLSYNCDNVGLDVQCQLFAGISSSEQELLIEEKIW